MLHEPGNPRDALTYAVIGAAMAVHRELGHGFLESVYREALGHELALNKVPFDSEVQFVLRYRGRVLRSHFRADLVCGGTVIVELKALRHLSRVDTAQVINSLKVSGLRTGLLFNFGAPSLEYRRLLFDGPSPSLQSVKSATSVDLLSTPIS